MTRGKYAAKANGQRAETAVNTAVSLRGQLDQMRRERDAEVTELKSEIGVLQGRLLREVRELAAAEVQRVQAEHEEALRAEREDHAARCRRMLEVLRADDVRMSGSTWNLLYEALGMKARALSHADAPAESRRQRRVEGRKFQRSAIAIDAAFQASDLREAVHERLSVRTSSGADET